MTKVHIHIHIETEDLDLAERIGRTLNGGIEPQQVPAVEAEAPKPEAVQTATAPETSTASDSAAAAKPEPNEPTSPATGVELDKAGLPWDERIHASSKALKADGYWKNKRGVDPELLKQVEAELRTVMAVPAPEPEQSATPPTVEPPAPEQGGYVAPPQDEASSAPGDFMTLVGLIGQKGIGQAQIQSALDAIGVPQFGNLNARPDLIRKFWEALEA